MATKRNGSYSQYNYQLDISSGTDSVEAGFQEVCGLGVEITVAEYRGGNFKRNAHLKVTGTHKMPDVTLKRGLIGAEDLYEWLGQIQGGKQEEGLRLVEIHLLSEDRETTVMTWVLSNARPINYVGPVLNGKGTDVGIEELVLACDDIKVLTAT